MKQSLASMILRSKKGIIRADIDADTTALSIGAFQLGVATQLRFDPSFDVKKSQH